MKLKFKHQPFQAEAAAAVCDVFNDQPLRTANYRIDLGDTTNMRQKTFCCHQQWQRGLQRGRQL